VKDRLEVSSEEADAIFAEVGQKLRHHRDLLGLSLDDVERHTHLRPHYLLALEEGNLRGLPSPVQGRGMLNNYAAFLGLDVEPLLLRFAEGLQARLVAQQAARSVLKPARPARPRMKASFVRRLLSSDFLIGGILILFLGGFLIWGTLRVTAMRSLASRNTATPTAPSIAEILLIPDTATASPSLPNPTTVEPGTVPAFTSGESTPLPTEQAISAGAPLTSTITTTPSLPVLGSAPIEVYVVVRQRSWIRVLVDEKMEFVGRVIPGRAYTFQGEERVEILAGNGAALQIFYNGSDLGVLGTFGEVIQRIFTAEGVQTPTATLTFTPLPTTPITPTPPTTSSPPVSSPTENNSP
jgi:cytoskeletal protein RodZ